MNSCLQVRDLRFLDWGPLSFTLDAGERLGISGTSGSGKSLLLRALADLDPHDGEVLLNGRASSGIAAPEWRRRVGMLPAESRWWHDRVADHFQDHDAEELFVELGFDGADVLDWEISRLSAGERQRLALARLLCRGPEVLLLDEPTANLDVEATARVEGVVNRRKLATIWVSHDREQLRRIADRCFRMEERTLREESP